MRLSGLKRYSLRTSFSEEPPGRRRDYSLLIPSQSRVLCREEQLLLTFSGEGSRQLKLNRASLVKQGAESAGRLFLISCSSTCRSTRIMRDLKSPALIRDQGLFCSCSRRAL